MFGLFKPGATVEKPDYPIPTGIGLQLCPFCGNRAEIRSDSDAVTQDGDIPYWVSCVNCPGNVASFYTAEDAAYEWNLRSSFWCKFDPENPPKEPVLAACDTSDCGWQVDTVWWSPEDQAWFLTGSIGSSQRSHLPYTHWRPLSDLIQGLPDESSDKIF